MQTKASIHLSTTDTVSAKAVTGLQTFATVGAASAEHAEFGIGPATFLYLANAMHGVKVGLAIAADLLPDLDHAELVAARHSIDALATRCGELMALLEFEDEADARSRGAEVVA